MKIIISENQIKLLKQTLLLESDDDLLTYTTKYDQKLYSLNKFDMLNYLKWQDVPKGTKFKFSTLKIKYGNHIKQYGIYAWNGLINFNCNGDFYVVKEGKAYIYRNDDLAKVLKNKFCSSNQSYKQELFDLYTANTFEKENEKNQDKNCINKITKPYNNAITWWKNKLNEPAFYDKLKKLNNYTDSQTKEWITKYKVYMDNRIYGPYCLTKGKDNYLKENPNTIAYATDFGEVQKIFYNVANINEDISDIESTFVHEIQHALYNLKPMTPDSNWKKVFPYKVWGGNVVNNSESPKEKTTISKYGLDQNVINYWKNRLKIETDKKNSDDIGYVCRITELASRVVTMKNLLNKKTKDKITVDEFKKFLLREESPYWDENAYWLCLCWVNNGMEDIQTFLDNLDKYVVAKVDTKNNDNMKDDVS